MKVTTCLAVIASLATLALTSCASSSKTDAATVLAKATKAAAAASDIITTAEAGGQLKKSDADKLRADIAKGTSLAATLGTLDFSDARKTITSLAQTGALPPQYALGLQVALLLYDLPSSS